MAIFAAMARQFLSPSSEEQERLCERIIRKAPVKGAKAQAVLRFLFKRSSQNMLEPIAVKDIVAELQEIGPPNQNAMNTEIHNIKELLAGFFATHRDGEDREPVRAEIQSGTHIMVFTPNWPECPLVKEFWKPYFQSMFPTILYYPEPQFFRYRNNVYIRHLEINSPGEHRSIEKLLQDGSHAPIPSHSFVPSGLVAAMSRLFECFLTHGVPLRSAVLPLTNKIPSGTGNIIILGIPTINLSLINSIEREWPMRTEKRINPITKALKPAIVVKNKNGKTPYMDQTQEDDDSIEDYVDLEKWGCLTRRIDSDSRVVTVISGHSRSVEGITGFLTQEKSLGHLKWRLHNVFPSQVQVRFSVTMQKLRGELEIQSTADKEAINMDLKNGRWQRRKEVKPESN